MTAKYPTYVGGRYAVYRIFNHAGELLYIGVARDFRERMYNHAAEKSWWGEIDPASIRIEWFDDARDASAYEREAIATELPLHNRAGKPGQRPTRYTYTPRAASGFVPPRNRAEFDAFMDEHDAYSAELDEYLARLNQ